MSFLKLLQEAYAYCGFFGVSYVGHDVEAGDFEFLVSACDRVAYYPAESGAEDHVACPVVTGVHHSVRHGGRRDVGRDAYLGTVEFVQNRCDGERTGSVAAGPGVWPLGQA